MDNENMEDLASQLRQPQGMKGIEVAKTMNETNIRMIYHSIKCLNILDNNRLLELGHANCTHLEHLLNQGANLTYCGLEMSELMNQESQRINKAYIDTQQASFYLYDGLNIPFPDNYFDRIFTVNTIYFWSKPELLLSELYRVTSPNGMMSITFAQMEFMKQLPFSQFHFELYDNDKIAKLVDATPFKIIGAETQTEVVKSKAGDLVDREFTTITMKKE